MNTLATHFTQKELPYTGVELRPHFLLSQFDLKGSALAAFIGPCHVDTEHLVDWEDRIASDRIEAKKMVHFIGEFFGMPLEAGVFMQRLFIATLRDLVSACYNGKCERLGDDLFVSDRKLSVSIVTASPVSILMHTGINIDPAGAPVPAIGLSELSIEPPAFARKALQAFSAEWEGIQWARVKVRPVI